MKISIKDAFFSAVQKPGKVTRFSGAGVMAVVMILSLVSASQSFEKNAEAVSVPSQIFSISQIDFDASPLEGDFLGGGLFDVVVGQKIDENAILKTASAQPGVSAEAVVSEEEGYAVSVNGNRIAIFSSEELAADVLEQVKAYYTKGATEVLSVGFLETVQVEKISGNVVATSTESKAKDPGANQEAATNPEGTAEGKTAAIPEFSDAGEAVTYILTGATNPKTYVVQGGDNLWDIAISNGISLSELQSMNPEISAENLKIGQSISLYEKNPYVTVQVVERITKTETIPYPVQYEASGELYKGQTQIKTPGTEGSKQVVMDYTKENGVMIASNLVSETVLAQPVTQIAYQGNKVLQIQAGSGSLQSPVAAIEVSSSFGESRGSRVHLGVDFRSPKGTAIMAADGGTVTFSSYSNSYGNVIKISHGNGVETRYAHCEDLLVNVGDTVAKGQVIGTIGNTGNATGYILHFEVRENGVAKNPMNYL